LISSSIKDYSTVLELLSNRAEDLETFATYAPVNRFIEAQVSPASLSFSVRDEDGSIFAMALGKAPVILKCDRLATTRSVKVDEKIFTYRNKWDFYSIDTDAFLGGVESNEVADENEIKNLLEKHAPNSSVWPGNEEIIFWGNIREGAQLIATGALVRWRTGQVMFASIATHSDYRGKGYAQRLVTQMLASAAKKGVAHVGLGVFAENIPAKRAYEKVGFNLVNEFNSYQLVK
jgi:RimJ/RimL family protein N-acetyltransferase